MNHTLRQTQLSLLGKLGVVVLCLALLAPAPLYAQAIACEFHKQEQSTHGIFESFAKRPECDELRAQFKVIFPRGENSCDAVSGILPEGAKCDEEHNQQNIADIARKLTQQTSDQIAKQLNEIYFGYDELSNKLNGPLAYCLPGTKEDGNSMKWRLEQLKKELTAQLKLLGRGEPQKVAKADAKDKADREPNAEKKTRRGKGPLGDINPGIRILLSTALGALAWRFRGGWLPTGSTQLARIGGILPFVGIGYLNGGWDGAIAGALLLPTLYFPWNKWQDMGSMTGSKGGDLLGMTARGLLQTSLSGAYLAYRGYGAGYLLTGAAMGPCYWATSTLKPNLVNPSSGIMKGFMDSPTTGGELCSGAALGGGLAASLIYGDPQDI